MSKKVRALFSFCAFHFVDDGFTDSIYLLLPFIAAELNLSFSQVGLLKGVFSGSMSFFQFPLSLLGERIGELTVIAAGTLGLATGFLILSKVYIFPLILLTLIFAKGTGGGQHGLSSSLLSRVFEISGRRAAMGTYNFSGDMGKVCFRSSCIDDQLVGVEASGFQSFHDWSHRRRGSMGFGRKECSSCHAFTKRECDFREA